MLKPFICGTGSFDHDLEEHDRELQPSSSSPTSSTPRKSRKTGSCKTRDNSKNPYSNRGLDKFSALLAELEDKRQQIYSRISPDEISLLRFAYTSSNDCRPIVIRVKQNREPNSINNDDLKEKPLPPSSPAAVTDKKEDPAKEVKEKKKKKSRRRPLDYLAAALILTLVLLVLFGKTLAIILLSMGWYLVPAIKGESFEIEAKTKTTTGKKKDYGRIQSEKMKMKMKNAEDDGSSSPNSVLGPMAGYATPRRQGRR